MKLDELKGILAELVRRAFTGAWIETANSEWTTAIDKGRAFTGAWIETELAAKLCLLVVVAPSQARGLKRY